MRCGAIWLSTIAAILYAASQGFAANPKIAWKKTLAKGGEIAAMVVDSQGNIHLTGTTKSGNEYPDFLTAKYSPSGRLLWASSYGQSGKDDQPSSLKVDVEGNVYVTGKSDGGASVYDFLTLKYNSQGSLQWAARLNNAENNSDFANDLAVDSTGNVYVTGGGRYEASDYDIVTVKYNPSGEVLWIMHWIGPGILHPWRDDMGRYITTDPTGNVYIAGTSDESGEDIVVIKADSSGQVLWTSRYDGPSHGNDEPKGLAIDQAGEVSVAGNSHRSSSDQDIILIRYASSGAWQWGKRYSSPGRYPEDVQDVFLDRRGNTCITGSANIRGRNKFVTLMFAANGIKKWTVLDDYTGNGSGASSLDVDGAGNVYVTGNGLNKALCNEIVTLKYNSRGKRVWLVRYSGPAKYDLARAVAVDSSGAVIVGSDGGYRGNWTIIKYIQRP